MHFSHAQARVNIPALSASTIKRGIAGSDFTITSDIQVRIQFQCIQY